MQPQAQKSNAQKSKKKSKAKKPNGQKESTKQPKARINNSSQRRSRHILLIPKKQKVSSRRASQQEISTSRDSQQKNSTRQRSQRGQSHRGPIVHAPLPLRFTCDIGQQFHGDRAFYYKGPWSVFYRGREVGHGEIMCFDKRQVVNEIQRQLNFWCVEYLDE